MFGEVQEKGHFDVLKEFDDLKGKLDGIRDLPDGSGPIYFVKDFGDTAALMLTVASPRVGADEIASRAAEIRKAIEDVRRGLPGGRAAVVLAHPAGMDPELLRRPAEMLRLSWVDRKVGEGIQILQGSGFIALDLSTTRSEEDLRNELLHFAEENIRSDQVHPDLWVPIIVRDPADTARLLASVAGDKYSYREMDNFTDVIERQLKLIPLVSKVERVGVLDERVYLTYSQNRLAAYGLSPVAFLQALRQRNITAAGGEVNAGGRNIAIIPAGEFRSVDEIGSVAVGTAPGGAPIYLRDVAEIQREYESPAQYLNQYTRRSDRGGWVSTRAITLSVQMRKGEQIGEFGKLVDDRMEQVKRLLPADLVLARTSDQPLQVTENIDLFMSSLWEAIVLVVVVSWLGFWSWRSAILMALAIPITLALTFGMMYVLGIDLQQVSIASLIIALGLLVDVPVVSGDAIERAMGKGHKNSVAAWLGPTKLFTTMMYATLTNIVAYLPFLMLTGDTGKFMYSLPIVITCSLIASQVVAMTFVPLISRYLLKPKPEVPIEQQRTTGYGKWYWKIGSWAIAHRKLVAVGIAQRFGCRGLAFSAIAAAVLPQGSAIPVVRRRVAARGRSFGADVAGQPKSGTHHPGSCRRIRPGAQETRGRPEVTDYVRGRGWAAVLDVGDSGSAAAELRTDRNRGRRQARHQPPGGPMADGAHGGRSRGTCRRAPTGDWKAHRHTGSNPSHGRRYPYAAGRSRTFEGGLQRSSVCLAHP